MNKKLKIIINILLVIGLIISIFGMGWTSAKLDSLNAMDEGVNSCISLSYSYFEEFDNDTRTILSLVHQTSCVVAGIEILKNE